MSTLDNTSQRTAVVTGAASGLGKAIAQTWADQTDLATHHRVLTAARRHKRLCRQHRPEVVDAAMNDALRIILRQRIFAGQPHHDIADAGATSAPT